MELPTMLPKKQKYLTPHIVPPQRITRNIAQPRKNNFENKHRLKTVFDNPI